MIIRGRGFTWDNEKVDSGTKPNALSHFNPLISSSSQPLSPESSARLTTRRGEQPPPKELVEGGLKLILG